MRSPLFRGAWSNVRMSSSNLKIPRRAVAVLVLAFLFASAAASTHMWLRAHKKAARTNGAAAKPLIVPTENDPSQQTVGLPIQLKKLGFVPMEITKPAGDYQLSVSNQSGVSEIKLSLGREHGEELHQGRLKKERLRWRQNVLLTPGTYVLSEMSHPNWLCRIVITPK